MLYAIAVAAVCAYVLSALVGAVLRHVVRLSSTHARIAARRAHWMAARSVADVPVSVPVRAHACMTWPHGDVAW